MKHFSEFKARCLQAAAFGLLLLATGAQAQAPAQTFGCFAPTGQTQSPYNGVWVPPPGAAGYNPGVNYCVPNFSVSPPLRKFVDALPGVGYANKNNLGQYIPLAKPVNLATFGTDDYYEIGLRQYNEQMHSDLPGPNSTAAYSGASYGTKLRGFYQKPGPTQTACDFVTTFPHNSSCVDTSSHYLGPMILAYRDTPVRLKFYNELTLSNDPSGRGYLPLPIDYNLMGAGMGRFDRSTGAACDPMLTNNCALYSDNRAVIHLHGGLTPWISDGTPHQWITPANEPTLYTKGDSFQNVPDMVVTSQAAAQPGQFVPSPGDGIGTYYYTNRQSGRLLFYHDHSLGQTRLNVYAGMAAPYLIVDKALEDAMITASILPDQQNLGLTDSTVYKYGIPLVIQDKSFVNGDADGKDHLGNLVDTRPASGAMPMPATKDADPLWFNHPQDMSNPNILVGGGATSIYPEWFGNPGKLVGGKPVRSPNHGDLWLPHEYLPNEDPFNTWFDPATQTYGANPMGRWDYSPWMNPPAIPMVDTLPSPSVIPETYGDTMVVNGTVFPYLTLKPGAARFRVLNASNDRFLNLQLYYASTKDGVVCNGSTYTGPLDACTEVSMVPAINYGAFQGLTVTVGGGVGSVKIEGYNRGRGYTAVPTVTFTGGSPTRAATGVAVLGTGAKAGQVIAVQITDFGSGYTSAPTVTIDAPPSATNAWSNTTAYAINDTVLVGSTTYVAIVPNTGMQPDISPAYWAPKATALATAYLMQKTTVDTTGWPASWPTDGRAGGVPYWAHSGPSILQIGNEAGFLAQVAEWPSQPVDWDHNTRSVTLNGVTSRSLMLPSAVRADVVVDFSGVPNNSALIMYNDAPAPMPLWDNRNDYYTGNDDQTDAGGAPSTEAGYGPNTRTVMQFRIQGTYASSNGFSVGNLKTNLPAKYAVSQKPPLVPQSFYPQTSTAKNIFATIADESLNVSGNKATIGAVVMTLPGQSYSVPPTVKFSGGNCTSTTAPFALGFPTARAQLNGVTGVNLTAAGSGYATAPAVTFSASPAGAAATAKAVSVISGGAVIGIYVTDPGYGYLVAPTVTVAAPPAGAGTTAATATAHVVTGSVGRITLDANAANFVCDSAPLVTLTASKGNPGTGATAVSTLTGALVLDGKNLVEGFDREYGRMDAILGSTPNPLTPWVGAGPVVGAAFYVDPPTELLTGGTTYLWRLMHIGVDSHAAHFHLFDLQVINRVDWTGVIKPPSADELGWKETVRTNPFEDIILALRPTAIDMQLPFTIPNSMRLLDPTVPLGSSGIFTPVAPPPGVAALAQTTNVVNNYYWEYVWHCHLLGHEENDMMRPIVFRPEMATGGISTQSLAFGNVVVGSTSASQTVTLTNSGLQPLSISSMSFSTSTLTGNDFRLAATPGTCFTGTTPVATLAAGANCTIIVTFTPSTAGPITGSLTIVDNSMGRVGSTQVVQLTGAGTSPLITVTPSTWDFGSVNLNTTSAAQAIMVSNSGNAALRISAITPTAPFATTTGTNACAVNTNVAAGGSCYIYVTYRPTATGAATGTLTISSNAAGNPTTTVSLSGTGAAVATPTLSISSLNFGANRLGVAPVAQTVTVTNTGGAGTTLVVDPANFAITAPYTISGTACNVAQGGAGCTFTIGLPASAIGTYAGTLTIATSDSVATTATFSNPVALSGSFAAPALTSTATTLTFGTATVPVALGSTSTSTVTLRNNVGTVPVVISAVAPLAAPYSITANTCVGATLNTATPTCTITVAYSPTTAPLVAGTPDAATLTVTDDANTNATPAAHAVAAFNGYAAQAVAVTTMTPSTLAFGSVTRNTVSAVQYITLKNNGTAAFAITGVVSSSARFQIASNNCGTSLAAGASCSIGVQFAPTAAGAVSGRVTINNSTTLRATLSGTGL